MSLPYVEIHFPLPLSRGYTYRVPEELLAFALPGCRALVPLGKRVATGFIVRRTGELSFPEEKLRGLLDVLDDEPLFDEARLALAQWVSEYYLAGLGEVLRTMLPPGLEKESRQYVRLVRQPNETELARLASRAPRQAEILQALSGREGCKVAHLSRHLGHHGVRSSLRSLMKAGFVEISQKLSTQLQPQLLTFVQLSATGRMLQQQHDEAQAVACAGPSVVRPVPDPESPAPAAGWLKRMGEKHWQGLALLRRKDMLTRAGFLRQSGLSAGALRTMVARGLVELHRREVVRNPYASHVEALPPLVLNEAQAGAVAEITAALQQSQFKVFLLYGITGSGKTQVYIEAIRNALALGRGAIALVPEISLTPQAVARFQGNFGGGVAVLHSRLSPGERYDAWRRVQRGEARLVIGPRSAVFAPMPNLGLVVVDEEHESSYKQVDPAPRYHARDVAIMRARMSAAVVVLGSATPAVESFHHARTGKYRLLELPTRIDNVPLPRVRLIDMMRFYKSAPDHDGVFSRPLFDKIKEKLALQEQIILLQNRRGFAPVVRCVNCGYTRFCEACNIPLTYHRRGHVLRCHYCNHSEKAPDTCPQCQGLDLVFKGIGTQKVEEALRGLLPEARVVRMDLDTTRGKLAHDRILREFGEHRYDILLGTQMIAKGLDFHRVTLVGVISADTGLLRPDFRAGERTFQLLTQVAGRAGRRNLPGEVIIQTYSPENFCLLCTQQHDFIRFYEAERGYRQALRYPPYSRVAVVLLRHRDNERARGSAFDFAASLRASGMPAQIYGPAPAPLQRIQSEYRWQLMIKSDPAQDPAARKMREALAQALAALRPVLSRRRVRLSIDIDPVAIL